MRKQMTPLAPPRHGSDFISGVVLKFFRGKEGNVVSVFRGKVVIPRFNAREGNMYPVILADVGRAWIAEIDPRYVKVVPVITMVQEDEKGKKLIMYRLARVFSASDVVLGIAIDNETYTVRANGEKDVRTVVEEKSGFRPAVFVDSLLERARR